MSRTIKIVFLTILSCLSLCARHAWSQSDHAAALIEGAKNEKKLVLYTSVPLVEARLYVDAFQRKYPFVQPEIFRASGEPTLNRILTETRAGRWEFDAVGITQMETLAQQKALSSYVSPETKAYIAEFKDPAGFWTSYAAIYYVLGYNTRLVAQNEAPKQWRDLLDAKWKGQFSMDREEYAWYATLQASWGKEKTREYMEALAKQDIQWRKDHILIAQLLAAGEFPLAIVYVHNVEDLKKKGAPVEWISSVDPIVAALRRIALSARPSHPSTAKLFIDFILSKEGQEIIRAQGRVPARSDVEPLSAKLEQSKLKLKAIPQDLGLRYNDYIREFRQIFGL
ncbi:MAG TPA: extracellular solute-binding protein [Candidatus Binatia bacterium]|jgi:iron(III) transport system substrate-binding protein